MLVIAADQKGDDEMVELNFVNTPIAHLTKLISEITGLNLVSDGDIPGNFTFVSQKPVKKSDLLGIYEMILRTKGYMVVNYEDKGFFMIVKNNDAQKQDIPFAAKGEKFEMSTALIDLKYFKPSEINKVVGPFLSPYGKISADDTLGYIMITDYPDGIAKIKDIVKKLDKQKDVQLHWVKMRYVNVKSIFAQIKEITAKLSEKYRKPINVYMDPSANSVIIAASGNDYVEVEKMVERLDLDSKLARRAEVIYLKNSVAEEVVKILQNIEKVRYESGEKSESKKAAISMDKSLNAIIILAEEGEVETYRNIIEDLDKPRKQVFVKADIVEINEAKASDIGIEYDNVIGGHANSDGGWAGQVNVNSKGSPTITAVNALFSSEFLKGASGFIIGATLNLLKNAGVAKTLSSPTLLCLDNQEASIYVGKNLPVKTSTSQQTDTTTVPVTNYTYKDIGLTLKVKPQIMNDDKVRLDVFTNLEEVISGAADQLPETTKRELKNTSIVNNGENIVIAGLIKTLNDKTEQKVPLLGDIPFIGGLFRNTYHKRERINLVIVLTPYVVESGAGLSSVSSDLKKDYKALQGYSHENFMLDDEELQKKLEQERKKKQEQEKLNIKLVPLNKNGTETLSPEAVVPTSPVNSAQSFNQQRGIITLDGLQNQ